MTTKHNEEFWAEEAYFILMIDPTNPGKDFNHNLNVFAGYCGMQANSAEADGFPAIADKIRNHILSTVE